LEYYYHEAEALLQKKSLDIEELKQKLSSTSSQYLTLEKGEELYRIIREIGEDKSQLEDSYLMTRSEFLKVQQQRQSAETRLESIQEVLEHLKRSKPSELSDTLIEMSERLQQIRLSELRANREAQELKEKHLYQSKTLKQKMEAIAELEEKTALYESQMHKIKEEFRKKDQDRQRRLFAPRDMFEGGGSDGGFPDDQPHPFGRASATSE